MKKINIAIDASFALGQKSGTGEYENQLIHNLSGIDLKNNYTIFPFFTYIYNPEFKKYKPNLPSNFKLFLNKYPKRIIDVLWLKLKFFRRLYTPKFDVFHSTTFSIPPNFMYKKLIVTIYDLSFYTHPHFHLSENVTHCYKGTIEAIKKADKIIAISNSTKVDLIKYMDCPEEKIVTTYLGYDELFNTKLSFHRISRVMKKYKVNKPFIFHLGSLEPRKNTLGLIKAYRFLPKKHFSKYNLLIGGGKGWNNNEIFEYVKKHNLEKNVIFMGYIPHEDLPAFYQKAKCFVYPSFYEGFGIPPLEAMASGCPVLTSNVSSLPEVCGDSALYCQPNNIEDIMKNISFLLDNKNEELISLGLKQAMKFSWKNTANKTLNIYL